MKINGINAALDIAIDNCMSYYLQAYDKTRDGKKEDFIQKERDFIKHRLLGDWRYTSILMQIENKYGPFEINIFDDSFAKKKDKLAYTLLFIPNLCELSNPNILFYDKDSYKDSCDSSVRGINLEDMAFRYVNKCLDRGYLIRFKNEDGTGYATANIRDIILMSGVPLQCIK